MSPTSSQPESIPSPSQAQNRLPPSGPAAAALVAAGVGCTVLGLATTLAEGIPSIKNALNFYDPVGPLSGKTIIAVASYFVSWIVLAIWLRGRDVKIGLWIALAFLLVATGLLLTFPPIYQSFTPKP